MKDLPLIDYGSLPSGEPVWLRAQREQLAEARVGLSALAPVCTVDRHTFDTAALSGPCDCRLLYREDDGRITVQRRIVPEELPPAAGLTDADVRRIERGEE